MFDGFCFFNDMRRKIWSLLFDGSQVAMATAAKAKLLLRELKTVKADLAFSKARCAQLEEENKILRDREGSEKGQTVTRADDDLVSQYIQS